MGLETFAPIDGYNGRYSVTSWGRVYDNSRGRFINPEKTKKGYLRVDLYDENGARKHHKVHRLVAVAFIENKDDLPQVDHIDGNKQNNSITNLAWVTNGENQARAKDLRKRLSENVALLENSVTKERFKESDNGRFD